MTNEIIPLIRKIANDKGLKIIDLNTPLIDKADYYADFLHPNDIGHRVMAEEIYKFLRPGYNFSKLKREKLDRGLVAVRESENVVNISWRYFSSDSITASFDIYRNGKKINKVPIANTTYFKDHKAPRRTLTYEIRTVGKSKKAPVESFSKTLSDSAFTGYINIPLDIPAEGTTTLGQRYFYSANDASIGDVDGDGEYEIILKWEPSNAHDNAHDGFTGNVYFDCYKLNGRKLWRIDLGKNIRAGAHYTQFMVFDLDADNKAEVVMKTADGTKDGKGNIIGDPTADYRNKNGRILTGPEFLTVFEGQTGKAVHTTDYIPPRGNLMSWGDDEANRADRFLACIAYLDGEHPSVVMCRGYYTRSVLAAFDYKDGKLTNRWVFDSDSPGNEAYAGQGNHNLRVGDVDGDGCDEIIYGSCAIDNTGKGLYSTGMGHGDAMHLTAFDPASKKLQVWDCHENKRDGSSFRDAETGKVIFQVNSNIDVGRCMAADIDPNSKDFNISDSRSLKFENIKEELDKCILLCSTCHKELHAGIIKYENKSIVKGTSSPKVWTSNSKIKDTFIENLNDIKNSLITGETNVKELSQEYKISEKYIIAILNANNIKVSKIKAQKDLYYKSPYPSNEELSKLMFEKPSIEIAKDLGISDVALGKHCKKNNIEKPSRGYWAKKRSEAV